MRGKAIKVLDLLRYSAELGNLDALFTLGQISLVWHVLHFIKLNADFISSLFLFSSLQTPTFRPILNLQMTHSPTMPNSQAMHPHKLFSPFPCNWLRRYCSHRPKPSIVILHLCRTGWSQMALGYRYWSGISTAEDYESAVEWYEAAADKGK